jgi:ABC-2 type transport system permease protein
LFFSGLFWLVLAAVFTEAFGFLRRTDLAGLSDELVHFLFSAFFLALTIMLVISNTVLAYGSFFHGGEMEWLMVRPLPPPAVFLYKFGETLTFSSWAFVFLALPMLAGYAAVYDAPALFLPGAMALFVLFMLIPAAVGTAVAALVAIVVPRSVRSAVKVGLFVAGTVAAVAAVRWLVRASIAGIPRELELAQDLLRRLGFARNPLLPSSWISEAVWALAHGDARRYSMFAGVVVANALLSVTVLAGCARAWIERGWVRSSAGSHARKVRQPVLDGAARVLLGFLDRKVRAIVWKDVKSFLRDPVQVSQFAIFFGILGIYFFHLRTFAEEQQDPRWKNLVAQLNLLATSLTLATFASRFVFPQVSLEGRRFWILGMAPMERERILKGKMALCFLSSLLVGETLIGISTTTLRTPVPIAVLQMTTLAGICLGISGLAVGLGTLYPQFHQDNPSKIVSGFGGTLNLVLMLAFVVAMLAIQMVPSAGWIHGALAGTDFRRACAMALIAGSVVCLCAALIPMALAMRRIRTMEV